MITLLLGRTESALESKAKYVRTKMKLGKVIDDREHDSPLGAYVKLISESSKKIEVSDTKSVLANDDIIVCLSSPTIFDVQAYMAPALALGLDIKAILFDADKSVGSSSPHYNLHQFWPDTIWPELLREYDKEE